MPAVTNGRLQRALQRERRTAKDTRQREAKHMPRHARHSAEVHTYPPTYPRHDTHPLCSVTSEDAAHRSGRTIVIARQITRACPLAPVSGRHLGAEGANGRTER